MCVRTICVYVGECGRWNAGWDVEWNVGVTRDSKRAWGDGECKCKCRMICGFWVFVIWYLIFIVY